MEQLRRWMELGSGLEAIRGRLIACGQLEQGLADETRVDPKSVSVAEGLTDLAAMELVRAVSGPREKEQRDGWLEALRQLEKVPDLELKIKTPEGFAFYALYPEQYIESTRKAVAARGCSPGETIWVIGIRGIGTTLSAVVAQALQQMGFRVVRCTVRLEGHPFQRVCALPAMPESIAGAWVVNEGPGLSGSSMSSVAVELIAAGLQPEKIVFLPGHSREPGANGSEEVRKIWSTTARFVSRLEELSWEGQTLHELLIRKSQEILGCDDVRIEDLSAGQWRSFTRLPETNWPPVVPQFERAKYLCTGTNGESLLWKYAGLGPAPGFENSFAQEAIDRMEHLAGQGWTPPPVASLHGFVAVRWINGDPFEPRDMNYATLGQLRNYIRASALPPMEREEAREQFDKIKKVIFWNLKEGMGDWQAELAKKFFDPLGCPEELPCYGDGRLAPHEWVRLENGNMLKTDCVGHVHDHTCIGRQSLLWDAAGVVAEWRVPGSGELQLRQQLRADGFIFTDELFTFYLLAYHAFKLGWLESGKSTLAGNPAELERIDRALGYHKQMISKLLDERVGESRIS